MYKHSDITDLILKAFYAVYGKLGYGFLEYKVGLLLNFGPKPDIKRKAYDNTRKGSVHWLEATHIQSSQ
jgi:hypothetical protein